MNSLDRYHSAYADDTWVMDRFVTLDLGGAGRRQRVAEPLSRYPFTGNWSPRVGINVDPFGDRKGKVFFNFGRNYWAMPLDAANRQLGNEQDDTSYDFAPEVVGALVVVPDDAHTLNGTAKDKTGAVLSAHRTLGLRPVKVSFPAPSRSTRTSMCWAWSARSRAAWC